MEAVEVAPRYTKTKKLSTTASRTTAFGIFQLPVPHRSCSDCVITMEEPVERFGMGGVGSQLGIIAK